MKKNNILKTIVVSLGILLLQSSPLLAGFGVSPTNIYNEFLKPGAHFEKTVTLSRSDPAEELLVTVEPSLDEIASWFQFDPGLQFTFPAGQTRMTFKVIVDVPEDATYRSFEGVIRVRATNPLGEVKGVNIVKGARLDVDLVTTEDNISDLLVRAMKMLDSVDGEPLKMEITAENQGNVAVAPTAKIVIKDLLMNELETLEDLDLSTIEPNETDTIYAEFYSTLPEGEYFVEAEVLLEDNVLRKERLVFRIVGAREGIEESTGVMSDALTFVKEYWVYIVASVLMVAVIFLLLTRIWNMSRLEELKLKSVSKFLGATTWSRVLISILLSAILVGASWYVVNTFLITEEVNVLDEVEVVIEEGTELEVVEDEVKGVSTVNTLEEDLDSFVVSVRDADGDVVYPIYESPDFGSDVIYNAKEGEDLAVLEERANWFRVLIGGQVDGWLDKSMVKSTVVEEVE